MAGELADGANALIYLAEGDTVNAAISAAAMVPGAGMAATSAKISKKAAGAVAEGAAKKAGHEAAEELAEKAQKEAAEKAEKELAERKAAEQEPKKSKDNDGGYIDPRRMRQHNVKCFNKNSKGDPKEYDRQLADQEKGLNDLTVQEYLEGRQRYQEMGRKGTGQAQQQARIEYSAELQNNFKAELNRQGIFGEAATQQASKMAAQANEHFGRVA